ncbi:hypothetical protein DFH11DRAFT_1551614 [Phellopilus nigrolimitatus]|nr:hypothetical protein DFH11DRAFT_1551614 [Phellopilus nigrolimitatus]
MLWKLQYINSHSTRFSGQQTTKNKAHKSEEDVLLFADTRHRFGAYSLGSDSQDGVSNPFARKTRRFVCLFRLDEHRKDGHIFLGRCRLQTRVLLLRTTIDWRSRGCLTGCMVGMGETDKAFEHAGFQLRSTINLHETPPSAIDLRAFRQIANKWGFDNIEKGVECAAPAKWLAAYLSILFHVPVKHSRRG